MKVSKEEILKKLQDKGLLSNKLAVDDLLTTYDFFLQALVNEEAELLEELLRIQEKLDANETLTYLEEVFYKYVTAKYK